MEFKRVNSLLESSKEIPTRLVDIDKVPITREEYKKIMILFFTKFAEKLISTGERCEFPAKLGALQMRKYKSKKKNIDYNTTNKVYGEYNKSQPNELKKYVYFPRAVKPILTWAKDTATFKNRQYYMFTLARPNIRINTYNKTNSKYTVVDFFRKQGRYIYKEITNFKHV